MTKDDIEDLKRRVDIVELIREVVPLERRGRVFFGLCPFHEEKTPSFAVDPERRRFHCYGCQADGDAIAFLMKVKGIGFQDALRELAARAGVSIEISSPGPVFNRPLTIPERRKEIFTPRPLDLPNETWREHAVKFLIECHLELVGNKAALRYLESRGITREMAERHALGWNPGRGGKDLYRPRAAWGLPEGGRPRKIWLPVGLVIPAYRDHALARLRIRRPAGSPKYVIVAGSTAPVMMLPPRREGWENREPPSVWLVVESELDAVLCAACQDTVGVIALGSVGVRPDAEAHAVLREAARILLAIDFDEAGKRAAAWWLRTYPQVRLWPSIKGKDPGEDFQRGVDIRAWIEAGLPAAFRYEGKRETNFPGFIVNWPQEGKETHSLTAP